MLIFENENSDFIGNENISIKSAQFVLDELSYWKNFDRCDNLFCFRIHKEQLKFNTTDTSNFLVKMDFDEAISYDDFLEDLKCILRFFGLIIGKMSYPKKLETELSSGDHIQLILNPDLYNLYYNYYTNNFINLPRIPYSTLINELNLDISTCFNGWYLFNHNRSYKILLDSYFDNNTKKTKVVVDEFLSYVKFLEGYHLRENDDEEKSKFLEKELKEALKDDYIKSKLSTVFKKVDSKYDRNNFASWISNGFLGRKALDTRIKELDTKFNKILLFYGDKVGLNSHIYKKIITTRNYYSHFKVVDLDILDNLYPVTLLLEILVVSILLSIIGVSENDIKNKVICKDARYINNLFIDPDIIYKWCKS